MQTNNTTLEATLPFRELVFDSKYEVASDTTRKANLDILLIPPPALNCHARPATACLDQNG